MPKLPRFVFVSVVLLAFAGLTASALAQSSGGLQPRPTPDPRPFPSLSDQLRFGVRIGEIRRQWPLIRPNFSPFNLGAYGSIAYSNSGLLQIDEQIVIRDVRVNGQITQQQRVARFGSVGLRRPGQVSFDFADATLSGQQRQQVERSHILAWQQVNVALQYLNGHARRILNGDDRFYNDVFGQFYDSSPDNPLLGQYDRQLPAAVGRGRGVGIADIIIRGGFTVLEFEDDTPFLNNLRVGDRLIVNNQVHTIAELQIVDPQATQNQGGQNQNAIQGVFKTFDPSSVGGQNTQRQRPTMGAATFPELESIVLNEPIYLVDPTLGPWPGAQPEIREIEIHRVVSTSTMANREHYERVVRVFESIRALLEIETVYSGDWDVMEPAFDRVFAGPGAGDFLFEGNLYDRSLRQFGFSNSDSQLHLDQLATDPANPLRWTEDNDRVFDANGDPIEGEDLRFYHDQLTIFGEFAQFNIDGSLLDTVNTVFLGGAYLDENRRSLGELFDGSVSNSEQRTDLLQYQMIVAGFAEFDSFFPGGSPSGRSGAAFGVMDIMRSLGSPNGTRTLPFPQNFDAASFGRFVNIFGDPRRGTGIGDGRLLRPLGKNAAAQRTRAVVRTPFSPIILGR